MVLDYSTLDFKRVYKCVEVVEEGGLSQDKENSS